MQPRGLGSPLGIFLMMDMTRGHLLLPYQWGMEHLTQSRCPVPPTAGGSTEFLRNSYPSHRGNPSSGLKSFLTLWPQDKASSSSQLEPLITWTPLPLTATLPGLCVWSGIQNLISLPFPFLLSLYLQPLSRVPSFWKIGPFSNSSQALDAQRTEGEDVKV